MAAMTTALTEFASNGNSRTSKLSTHALLKPVLVIEKRNELNANSKIAEYSFITLYGVDDADGIVLPQKLSIETKVRKPILMDDATVDAAALATHRDIIAGDEFTSSYSDRGWLSP